MGCHRRWRAQAKKMRRKRFRQRAAQERDHIIQEEQERKESSPHYQAWLSEQRALELFAEEEEARQSAEKHAAWMAEEVRAQRAWQDRQEKLAQARVERAKQEIRIREEWEEEQKKLKVAREELERKNLEKKQKQEELMRQIEDVINRGGDMPADINVASASNPDRPTCPFFTKTGACRFGDRCSRNHSRPGISRVLLIPNFYDHIGLRLINPEEPEAADDWLEYEDAETYQHFLEFFEDVLPEWERVGRVSQFKVCCNFEPHLKGNVYVEYENVCDAVKAFKDFHGRWYGGKQINVEFVKIDSWKAAICGQFHNHRCPKGRLCNFLHVFRNPGNAFHSADNDRQAWRRRHSSRQSRSPDAHSRSWSRSPENNSNNRMKRNWQWSPSPSPPRATDSYRSRSTQSSQLVASSFSNKRRYTERNGREHSVDKRSRRKYDSKGHSSRRLKLRDEECKSRKKKNNSVHYYKDYEKVECASAHSGKLEEVHHKYVEVHTNPGMLAEEKEDDLRHKTRSILKSSEENTFSAACSIPDVKASFQDVNLSKFSEKTLDRRKKKEKKKKEKSSRRKNKRKKNIQHKSNSPESSSSTSSSSGLE